jgi:two-component system KDP operon response regulator KdpE
VSPGRARVLVIDDDPLIVRLVRTHVDRAGFQVSDATDGQSGLDLAARESPDFVILDLMLPGVDGYEVCRRLRELSLVPVLMLTARGEQVDKLRGFEMGADDYLTKPFSPAELIARVQAVLRRSQQGAAPGTPSTIRCGDVAIDLARRRVSLRDQPIRLTPTEFRLLEQLALNAGKVLTHTELLTQVWGSEYRDDRDYLWAYVRHLRRKLEPDPEQPTLIISEPGVGYVLDCPS